MCAAASFSEGSLGSGVGGSERNGDGRSASVRLSSSGASRTGAGVAAREVTEEVALPFARPRPRRGTASEGPTDWSLSDALFCVCANPFPLVMFGVLAPLAAYSMASSSTIGSSASLVRFTGESSSIAHSEEFIEFVRFRLVPLTKGSYSV